MSRDDIDAIKTYFDSHTATTPEAGNIAAQFQTFYAQLIPLIGGGDDDTKKAENYKYLYDAANNTPANLDTAADINSTRKTELVTIAMNSPALTQQQKAAAKAASPNTSTAASVPANAADRPTIRLGSSGAAVQAWQQIIGTATDGKFGPNTQKMTIAWQKQHGLVADGVVGPKTWSAAIGQPVQSGPAPSAPIPNAAPAVPAPLPPPAIHPAAVAPSAKPSTPSATLPTASSVTAAAGLPMVSKTKVKQIALAAGSAVAGFFLAGPWGAAAGAAGGYLGGTKLFK